LKIKFFKIFLSLLILQNSNWAKNGDIIVNAEKFKRNYLDSTSSIFVIDEAEIEKLNAQSLAEILKRKGGFSIQTSGAFGKASSINLRGTDNRHTLVLIDGVRVTDITSIDGGTRLEFLDPDQIERIEVLKGNQGALYGSEAVGGVISITTKKGNKARIGLGYGSFGQKRVSAYNSVQAKKNELTLMGIFKKINGISAYNEKRIDGLVENDGLTQEDFQLTWKNESIKNLVIKNSFDFTSASYLYDDANADNSNLYGEYQTSRLNSGASYTHSEWLNIDLNYSHFNVDRKLFGENGGNKFNYLYEGNFDRYSLTNKSFYFGDGEFITGIEFEKEKTKALDQLLDMTRDKDRAGLFFNNYNKWNGFIFEEGVRYEKLQFFGDKFVYRLGAGYTTGQFKIGRAHV